MYEKNLNWQDYEKALYQIFPKEKLDLAISIFNGKDSLIDTTYDKKYLDILEIYEELGVMKFAKISCD